MCCDDVLLQVTPFSRRDYPDKSLKHYTDSPIKLAAMDVIDFKAECHPPFKD
jgi:hypothetical protein